MIDAVDFRPLIEVKTEPKKRPFCNWRLTPQKLFLGSSLLFGAITGKAAWVNFDYRMATSQADEEVWSHTNLCDQGQASVGEDAQAKLCQQIQLGYERLSLSEDDYRSLITPQTVTRLKGDLSAYDDAFIPFTITGGFFIFSLSKMKELHRQSD